MGLDTTHDCWHGAYGAFARWRNMLAEIAGYHVEEAHIRQYRGDPPTSEFVHENYVIDWGHVTDLNLAGYWGAIPTNIRGEPDPLLILLAHSDCDGVIEARHCRPLAERLEQLIPLLPDEEGGGHIGKWRDKTGRFVAGLYAAADAGEDVEFH